MSDEQRTHGGLSAKTLLIAGAASAAAALVIPMLWRPGTVFAAAMTPVVVALVTEVLRRPVETVSAVRVRRTPRGTAILDPPPEEPFDPLAPPSAEDLAVLPADDGPAAARGAPPAPALRAPVEAGARHRAGRLRRRRRRVHRIRAGRRRRRLGRRGRTTFFGGSQPEQKRAEPAPAKSERRAEEEPEPSRDPRGDRHADAHGHPDAGADGHRDARSERRPTEPTPAP